MAPLVRLALGGLVLGLGTVLLSNMWVGRVASPHAYAEPSSAPAHSFAVVPGAAVQGGAPLGSLTGRLQTALALYRAGQVKGILISGNDLPSSPEVPAMRRWLLAHNVPAADIVSDVRGSRTRNTMLDAAGLGVTDAIICTQALYVDRAVFLARQAGIDAVGIGVSSSVSGSWRNVGTEALKTTLAFFESYLREGPATARATRVAIAMR